jgi:hypothetical protein
MTPEQHAKAIEDAAHRYARNFAVYCDGKEPVDLGVCNVSLAILQSAIIAGVGAAPEGWQLVPVKATIDMLSALSGEWHHSRHQPKRYVAMLAAAPKP